MCAMRKQQYQAFKKRVFNFLWTECEPLISEMEITKNYPKDKLFPKFRKHGLWGLLVPKEYGGMGLNIVQYLPILAETQKVSLDIRGPIHVHNSVARAIAVFGTKDQKKKYLPRIATGESSMAFCFTEANAGSGMDLRTKALRDGDYYIINGEKHLISNSDFADKFMTACWTGNRGDRNGMTAIIVPRDTPGFILEPMNHPMVGTLGHGILTYKNAKVPVDSILGEEGEGLHIMLGELEPSRLFVAASSLGTAQRALEIALDYSKKRVTYGKPIAHRQAIQILLAEMAADVYALKLMLIDCAKKVDRGERCPLEASMCKLSGLEAVSRVTDKAMEVLGGRAWIAEYPYPFERIYRECRINKLEEGTPSIQKIVIARRLLEENIPLRFAALEL